MACSGWSSQPRASAKVSDPLSAPGYDRTEVQHLGVSAQRVHQRTAEQHLDDLVDAFLPFEAAHPAADVVPHVVDSAAMPDGGSGRTNGSSPDVMPAMSAQPAASWHAHMDLHVRVPKGRCYRASSATRRAAIR